MMVMSWLNVTKSRSTANLISAQSRTNSIESRQIRPIFGLDHLVIGVESNNRSLHFIMLCCFMTFY